LYILEPLELAKKVAHLAADKKAENIVLLDMREIVNYADYFVVCSGTSTPHLRAIADGIDLGVAAKGVKAKFRQGFDSMSRSRGVMFGSQPTASTEEWSGRWGLLDLGDVVVHIFEDASREFYGLEHLWQEAKRLEWEK
jgi:ribosome-associated protein